MKTYIGTKLVKMQEMTRQDYNDYRGWELPEDEDGADEGYLVEYLDGGQANHEDHEGYISWSPKGVAEQSYLEVGDISHLAPHQQRVMGEKAELFDRVTKLGEFTKSEAYKRLPLQERLDLKNQRGAMAEYLYYLKQRISRF